MCVCVGVCLSLPVQVCYGDDLSSYKVVESVDRAGVDETVSYPDPCLHHLLDLPLDLHTHSLHVHLLKTNIPTHPSPLSSPLLPPHLEGILYTVLCDPLVGLLAGGHLLGHVAQDEEGVLGSDAHQLPRV